MMRPCSFYRPLVCGSGDFQFVSASEENSLKSDE